MMLGGSLFFADASRHRGGSGRGGSIPAGGAAALALLAALVLAGRASAQYPGAAGPAQPDIPVPGISASRPRFSTDAAIQPGVGGAPEVRIDYRLARTELLFERTPDGFRAAHEIRVGFYPQKKKDKLVQGGAFTRELRVARYSETVMQGQDIVDFVTFRLAPGKYLIDVKLTDLNAERTSSTQFQFEVPGTPPGAIWFTDLTMVILPADSVGAGSDTIQANPSRRYGENLSRLAVAGEIVDGRPAGAPDSVYRLHFDVFSDLQTTIARGDTAIARQGNRTPFRIRPRLGALQPGTYRLVVDLTSPLPPAGGKKRVVPPRREKVFTVEQTAASVALDPRAAVDVLRYVASESEQREMDRLHTPEERQAFWESFWKRRDPSPDTPQNEAMDEFYKRVQYADQHFGAGGPGWRTDMGRHYIRYGQPDEIVRNPFRFEGPPEEIWYYYRERLTFYFVDRDGFGRYELDIDRSSKTQ